jgi:hypothetical protein
MLRAELPIFRKYIPNQIHITANAKFYYTMLVNSNIMIKILIIIR